MKFTRLITNNPIFQFFWVHLGSYPAPKNINYSWSFGALSGMCLVIQILSGLFLSMHYVPEIHCAFSSVEHIMRDVNYGWFLRYLHANGASMFFLVIFFHIFRNFYFSSYQNPRIHLWFSGVIIFLLLMATAFLGYVLPWGQMSFWGATVITNLFSAIPVYGITIVEWLWGGFSVDQATLNRFYSLHFVLPFIIAALALVHIALLHQVGSSDPVSADSNKDNIHPGIIPFYPYFVIKDFYAFIFLVSVLLYLVFFMPNLLGHPDNYIEANPMVTPAHIVPEWYFLPFYAILRSIPNKLGGVVAMVFAILGWLILPIFTPVQKSAMLKILYRILIWLFAANFILLGWIGQQPAEYPFIEIGGYCTFLYFFILFQLIPLMFFIEDFIVSLAKLLKILRALNFRGWLSRALIRFFDPDISIIDPFLDELTEFFCPIICGLYRILVFMIVELPIKIIVGVKTIYVSIKKTYFEKTHPLGASRFSNFIYHMKDQITYHFFESIDNAYLKIKKIILFFYRDLCVFFFNDHSLDEELIWTLTPEESAARKKKLQRGADEIKRDQYRMNHRNYTDDIN